PWWSGEGSVLVDAVRAVGARQPRIARREDVIEAELELVEHGQRDGQAHLLAREEPRSRASAAPDRVGEPLHRVELTGYLALNERAPTDDEVHVVVEATEVHDDAGRPLHPRHHYAPSIATTVSPTMPPGARNRTRSPT